MKHFFNKIIDYICPWRLYIVADSTDNSITLSRALFERMGGMELHDAKVFTFRVGDTFAFTINPQQLDGQETQFSSVQYNTQYRTIGFESLCPSVCRILFEFGLPADAKVKLSIRPSHSDNLTYFKIVRPHV